MEMTLLAPYPSSNDQAKVSREQWDSFIEAWLSLVQKLLSSSDELFLVLLQDAHAVRFLSSYIRNSSAKVYLQPFPKPSAILHNSCFLLLHRVLLNVRPVPEELLEPPLLARVCIIYARKRSTKDLLEELWIQHKLGHHEAFLGFKSALIKSLETAPSSFDLHEQLRDAATLAKYCNFFAQYLLTGSDFADALSSAYAQYDKKGGNARTIVSLAHTCLNGLVRSNASTTFLIDQLFTLHKTKLMEAVIQTTLFYFVLEQHVSDMGADAYRLQSLLEIFATYQPAQSASFERPRKARTSKEKGRAIPTNGDATNDEIHAHKMSLVSQVQDLFPDLGSGFIIRLLDEYHNDTEQVTAHLLDDNLPQYLQHADRTAIVARVPSSQITGQHIPAPSLTPRSLSPIPSERRNVYDNDDFDQLKVDPLKLHFGRKNAGMTADHLLAEKQPENHKDAILSALATFDSDDDERDDSYDTRDVGGMVDRTFEDGETHAVQDKSEELLFTAYKDNNSVFSRDAQTRRSQARSALREQSEMTDEAIEGWAIMIMRDPRRLKHLEDMHEINKGLQQQALAPSSWKAGSELNQADDSDIGSTRMSGSFRGPEGFRGQASRGAATLNGSPSCNPLHHARQRKDANKASRSNHNRRDQRARKMARGGGFVG